MILFGNVEGADLKISTKEFFMHNKRIRGFNLPDYVSEELDEERRKVLHHLYYLLHAIKLILLSLLAQS